MIAFLYGKFIKNKWLFLSLLLGFTLSVAIVSSVPMYSAGIFKRVFLKDMEAFSKKEGLYPGTFSVRKRVNLITPNEYIDFYNDSNKTISSSVENLNLPIQASKCIMSTEDLLIGKLDSNGVPYDEQGPSFSIETITGLDKNITIVEGRLYSDKPTEDNIYEVMISDKTQKVLDLKLDQTYSIRRLGTNTNFAKVKLVGIYQVDNLKNHYWLDTKHSYSNALIMHEDVYLDHYLLENDGYISLIDWFFALDYNQINLSDLKGFLSTNSKIVKNLTYDHNLDCFFPMNELLTKYQDKQGRLKVTLWTLQAPVILMSLLYVFMLSRLILEKDSNEIALLKSRGSSNTQVFLLYFLQFFLMAFLGAIIGPFVALFACRLLGASDGFLKFVNRLPLDLNISLKEWRYSFGTALVFLLITLIPIMNLSKSTIVETKRKKHRSNKPLWQRFYLDFILLAVSIYSLYSYKNIEKLISKSSVRSTELPISPLLYISMSLFVISLGLVCLRIYPYIISFIFKIGKNKWSATTYTSLINVSRNKNKDSFLMIFLILTVSIGIFNLKSASTINTMAENKAKYLIGSDIVLNPWWLLSDVMDKDGNVISLSAGGDAAEDAIHNVPFKEPPFKPYTEIEGVESATKVLKSTGGILGYNDNLSPMRSQVIAVIPDEFGKTAWFDYKLLNYHWYHYLNMIAQEPQGILISENLRETLNLQLGSEVYVRFGATLNMQCYVLGIVDYWPSYDPNKEAFPGLIVMNYNYVRELNVTLPYEIWLKKSSKASNDAIYKDLINKDIGYEGLKTVHEQIYNIKNDPIIQGTNGTLNLCFLSSILITCMGFLIYWTLSIKNRTLQFGILRAIGLSMKNIIGILAREQLLISGISIILGVFIGGLASSLYLPMINLSSNPKEKLLPFRPVSHISNYINLTLFMFMVLFIVMLLLAKIVKQIKIDQALKLGED
ncbi:ABC transporter permease [Clostridium amazonitimonense]|uniref:ABC transporter permease n=1 Tax=Clostridium amazonitimonense TaxID=1499689 RepID=UPI0005094D4D|nr:ABC transporter permease [Clostridium amazonitimonense]